MIQYKLLTPTLHGEGLQHLNKIISVVVYYFHVMWFPVTTAWHVLGLRTEEMASRFEGRMSSRGQPTRSEPPAWWLCEGLNNSSP
jgi:hypothetical protein